MERDSRHRVSVGMVKRPVLLLGQCALAMLVSVAAEPVRADDASRALTQRQQQSEAFSLQLQQSIQRFRAGEASPQQRLELESLQQRQRQRQDELFYRQDAQPGATPDRALHRAESMRREQQRQMQQDRFTREVDRETTRPRPAAPNPQPAP
jgi:hypothetical protein